MKIPGIPDLLDKVKEAALKQELDKKKLTLFTVLFALVIYADFSFVMRAQVNFLRTTGPRIAKIKKDLTGLQNDIARIKDFEKKQGGVLQQDRQTSGPSKRVITEEEIPAVLQFISRAAQASSIKITQIKPFRDPKAKDEVFAGLKAFPLAITVDARVTYHALGKFIQSLEASDFVISVRELRINRSEYDYLQMEAGIGLVTYVKK